jgi:parallel beta-helix repeat protein
MRIFSGSPPVERVNTPLVGDWNGNGTDTTGIYNYTTAEFSLDSGLKISFGISGDIPITGDWNGNGSDTIGVFRPSTAQFFIDYDNDGVSDMNATFGVIGDIPVAGDWDGDGDGNIGVFRQNHSGTGLTMFFLDLDNSGGSADQSVAFGEPDDLPVIGDWDGDGDDNIGLYRPSSTTGVFYLDIDNDGGIADIVTPEYGDLGDIPIAGDWDGDSDDNIGVYRPGTGEFFMDATVPDVLPSKTIYVDNDFDDEPSAHRWDTIQEGVADASDGDTVVVYAGVYWGDVKVNKSITLEGAGAGVVTVSAADASDDVFYVTADWVRISGFTVTGATGGIGIYLHHVNHCNIHDNNASDNCHGISLCGSSDNMLSSNTASNNEVGIGLSSSNNNMLQNNTASYNILDYGIWLWNSSDNTLHSNDVSNNDYGIFLESSNNNSLAGNTVSNSYYGIYLLNSRNNNTVADNIFINGGLVIGDFHKNTVKNNTVNGKPLVYLDDTSNFTIQNAGQVILVNCTNITAENLDLSNASVGVELLGADDCKITNNTVSNNLLGIAIGYSSNNVLTKNTASNNYYCGIHLYYSNNNTLYHNNLIDNTNHNAYDECTNAWDSGSEGNYYSDYNSTDPDGDGIGEDPYQIPGGGGSVDNYPLMQPWTGDTQRLGDLNGDDRITPADAAIALAFAAGGSASCDPAVLAAADVSGDDRVTALDALMILQAAAGGIEL